MSIKTETLRTTSVVTRVRERAGRTPDAVALREKALGIWREVTWARYWDQVELVAHALLACGIEPGDRVAIHAENRREWLYADLGIVAARAVTVGLYPTNPAPEVAYLLAHSGSRILIAEDQEQVDKALAVAKDCPDLERIVYIEPRGIGYADPRLISWQAFLEAGAAHRAADPGAVERRLAQADPGDVMTLIYTSGTTGPPKGVMLTIGNVEYAVETLAMGDGLAAPPPSQNDLVLSYLPLCHVAERAFTVWFNAAAGVQVNFAESIDTVQVNLREVQPTILFGVPRIWEKVLAGVNIRLESASPLKRAVLGFWLRAADRIGDELVRTGGRHTPKTRFMYALGWLCVYRALRERLGMRRVRYAASGAAPIAPGVLKFFMGIGLPMHEVYGMTENSAIATANRPGRVRLGTVGEAHAGAEIRLDEMTGEILTRHRGTFAGYWRDPRATAGTLDDDGWLRTGDIGEWAEWTAPDGSQVRSLRIVDRMKDIIITAGGKNISPSELENALKASPYVREAFVVGDRRPYLAALIGIELDTVGEWARRRGLPYTTYRDLSEKKEVRELVQDIVNGVNERFARVEQVKRFAFLPKELGHEDGELTATQKLKRGAVESLFADLVEGLYK